MQSIIVSDDCAELIEQCAHDLGISISDLIINSIVFGRPMLKDVPQEILKIYQTDPGSLSDSERQMIKDHTEQALKRRKEYDIENDPYLKRIKQLEVGAIDTIGLGGDVQFEAFSHAKRLAKVKYGITLRCQVRGGIVHITRVS